MRLGAQLCTLLIALGSSAADAVLPDPRTGNVGGRAGVLYWPSTMPSGRTDPARPLPSAARCEAHLVPETDAEQELQYPCGQWFAPPVNKYRVWIEAPGRISPRQNLLVYAGTAFREAGLPALAPLVPAGGVGIPDTRPAAEGESIRLFATTSRWSPNAFLFDRRLHTSVVQMPAGDSVIVGRLS